MATSKNYIHLGYCTRPHGIKGEFSLKLFNTQTSLKLGAELFLKPKSESSSIDPSGENFHLSNIKIGNKIIAHLNDISDRTISEQMVPFDIYIRRDSLPELKDGEYYLVDLIGFEVMNVTSKEKMGVVHDFGDNGAGDIIIIKELDGGLLELPMVDNFVKEVNQNEKKVWVQKPEYI